MGMISGYFLSETV